MQETVRKGLDMPQFPGDAAPRIRLLYFFCRLQSPRVPLGQEQFTRSLERTFLLAQRKNGGRLEPAQYLDGLYTLDWYLASACLEKQPGAWEVLFAARTGRSDHVLVDALRARAGRLYPRDAEKQEAAVTDFWSCLLIDDRPGGEGILARYDGLRPLLPWLIRVFQNQHLSLLRKHEPVHQMPDDDLILPVPSQVEPRWHEAFCRVAREALEGLSDQQALVLGLRWRYRLTQREVATLVDLNEGNVSRQITQLRERWLERITVSLQAEGWTGDDVTELIDAEMGQILLDEPRLSAGNLRRLLRARGKELPGDERS